MPAAVPTGLDAETRALIADTLARFVDEAYPPATRLARLNVPVVDYRLHWPLLAELGVLGLPYSEALGGMGGGVADVASALQVLARGLVLEPVADASVIASALLAAHSDATLRAQAAAEVLTGESLGTVVGLPPHGGVLQVRRRGAQLRLDGTASVVAYAVQADVWWVAACDADAGVTEGATGDDGGGGGLCILRVPRTHPGVASAVQLSPCRLMDGRPAADLHFDGLLVDAASLWLDGAAAQSAWRRTGELVLAAHAADAVGTMAHLLTLTGDYLRTRVQFGVPIGSFQALQHRYADMHMDLLDARALLQAWTRALDQGNGQAPPAALQSALLRIVGRAGQRIGHESIQMHGGMGVTEELVVSHCNARLQVIAGWLQAWADAPATLATEHA